MHDKISGKSLRCEHGELKLLWKWLKDLGHHYNISQKWKKILMEMLGMRSRPEDFTLDDILQKAIIELNHK